MLLPPAPVSFCGGDQLRAVEAARVEMKHRVIVLRPDHPDVALAVGGDGGGVMIAAAGDFVQLAAAGDHDAIGGVLIGEPGHPARAVGGDGERGIIVGRAGFGEALLDGQALHAGVAAEQP